VEVKILETGRARRPPEYLPDLLAAVRAAVKTREDLNETLGEMQPRESGRNT
jgi:hypothetical protein